MLLWLNGAFGVGKTTTATALTSRSHDRRLFDPEGVGYMLRANLGDLEFSDFQEFPPWRRLVPQVAAEIMRFTGVELVAVQTVLVKSHWEELRSGFEQLGIVVTHVVLDCEDEALRRRIIEDDVEMTAAEWRLAHIETYRTARQWMAAAADLVVDVTGRAPSDAAALIEESLTVDN